ncbi:MAG TPA: hypothetical protein VMO26_22030 [Vicinamibacterales bacterium]|nr:hypothetical protein [Vicinamibacterales bacterium]
MPKRPWYPQLDNIGKHVGRIAFRAPAGYTIAATGRRVEAEPGSVATYDVVVPSSFNFAIAKCHVHEAGGDVRLGAYLLRPRPHDTALVDGAREILQGLRALVGPFPYPEFALVEVPEEFGASGSMAATVDIHGRARHRRAS